MASKLSFKTLTPAKVGKTVLAVGATDKDGVFVALVASQGFCLLDLSGGVANWTDLKGSELSAESVDAPELEELEAKTAGAFGLHFHREADSSSCVSFPATSLCWTCWRQPQSKEQKDLVSRNVLKEKIVAACSSPGDGIIAIALAGGSFRFLNASSGKSVAKGLRLVSQRQGSANTDDTPVQLACAGRHRVVAARGAAGSDVDVFIFKFDIDACRCTLEWSGSLALPAALSTVSGPLQSISAVDGPGVDRLLLCWPSPNASKSSNKASSSGATALTWASAELQKDAPVLKPLGASSHNAVATEQWTCSHGFLIEFLPGSVGGTKCAFEIRDAHLGMPVTTGCLQVGEECKGVDFAVSDVRGGVTALFLSGTSGLAVGVRWTLPSFGLRMLVGANVAKTSQNSDLLKPLHAEMCRKRPRDEPCAALFARGKGQKTTAAEDALIDELANRRWRPCPKLVDVIIEQQSWEVARQLLRLPELDDDLAIRLLVARPILLPGVIRCTFGSRHLAGALQRHLPASQLPSVVKTALEFLDAHASYTLPELCAQIPSFPRVAEVVGFLTALAEGCFAMITSLDADLLECMEERLSWVSQASSRRETLHAAVFASCRIAKAPRLAAVPAAVELFLLPI